MGDLWTSPRWWQTLAAALAVGALAAGAWLWLGDPFGTEPPGVVQERPPSSLEVVYRPRSAEEQSATIICAGSAPQAVTGAWSDDPERACRTLYSVAPVLLEDATPSGCVPRPRAADRPFLVRGRIGEKRVERRFHRKTSCAEEAWQGARALVDPWLELESPELEERRPEPPA